VSSRPDNACKKISNRWWLFQDSQTSPILTYPRSLAGAFERSDWGTFGTDLGSTRLCNSLIPLGFWRRTILLLPLLCAGIESRLATELKRAKPRSFSRRVKGTLGVLGQSELYKFWKLATFKVGHRDMTDVHANLWVSGIGRPTRLVFDLRA
jgi:hypothetical protein